MEERLLYVYWACAINLFDEKRRHQLPLFINPLYQVEEIGKLIMQELCSSSKRFLTLYVA
jgi:hypothetical protein